MWTKQGTVLPVAMWGLRALLKGPTAAWILLWLHQGIGPATFLVLVTYLSHLATGKSRQGLIPTIYLHDICHFHFHGAACSVAVKLLGLGPTRSVVRSLAVAKIRSAQLFGP